jgi:hypothetical protein
VTLVSAVLAPANASEAMAMVRAGLLYLAAADPAQMTPQAQAEYLRAQEQNDAISTATRARILAAFTAGHGYTADADYSATSWLIHRTASPKPRPGPAWPGPAGWTGTRGWSRRWPRGTC